MNKNRKILVVDGNTEATNAANVAAGGLSTSVQYAAVLKRLMPALETVTVQPCEHGADCLPAGQKPADFDGVVWTGSALNVYEPCPEIDAQLQLAAAVWESAVPVFGSCWGLQVFATVLGGKVHKNPRGREFGAARSIYLTDEGRAHPMYAGKPRAFDALASHTDEIIEAPAGAVLLASNAMCQWHALAIEDGARSFWGVQYHPELDLGMCSVIMKRYGQRLVDGGLFADTEDLKRAAADWHALHLDSGRTDIAFKYGFSSHVLDRSQHERELSNWLQVKVTA
jgi:GMP synthase (glutamine-hydrolysing)